MSKLFEIKDLWRIYRSAQSAVAVKNVSFHVRRGDYLAIVGPSGAGKSTLLHIMGGLDKPTRGNVFFEGRDLYRWTDREISFWRNKCVGFVFQFYHLIEELNVIENIILPARINKAKTKKIFKKAQELLEYLQIEERRDFFPFQLSGGERQKVAIARALINEPEIIFCDEPTGNVDTDSAEKIIDLIANLNRDRKITVIVVTHNRELAKNAQKVLMMKGGELIEEAL